MNPLFYINDCPIEYVKEWQHLGNIIETSQSDSACIINRRNKAIGQINDVGLLCYFAKSIAKTKLLYAYCSSFYGSVLWDLQRTEIQRICSAWRIALRRIWSVPRNTHCNIVAALSDRLPLFDELCSRTINFHYSCLKSKNMLISNLVRYTVRLSDDGAQSPHGRNIRFLCSEFNLKYSSFDNIACHKDIASLFHNNQYDRCHDFDKTRFNVFFRNANDQRWCDNTADIL